MSGAVDLLSGIAAVTIPLVFLASSAGHARRPGGLAGALRSQRVLPGRAAAPIATAVITAEALLGVGGVAAFPPLRSAFPLRPVLAGAAVLLAAFSVYGWYVVRARPLVPCGCGGSAGTPMTGWVAGRAAGLAGLAAAGAIWAGRAGSLDAAEIAICLPAGAAFAVLAWTLPLAMLTTPPAGPAAPPTGTLERSPAR